MILSARKCACLIERHLSCLTAAVTLSRAAKTAMALSMRWACAGTSQQSTASAASTGSARFAQSADRRVPLMTAAIASCARASPATVRKTWRQRDAGPRRHRAVLVASPDGRQGL